MGQPQAPNEFDVLRAPFREDEIGKLPRITCKDCRDSREKSCGSHRKTKCPECHNWITSAHIHLDYVGHAELTDRLLDVDPEWTWEPMATDANGLPLILNHGSQLVMWGRLTILGITRLGVGTCAADKPEAHKELIGDFLRNAGMRFGVALNLWRKSERHAAEEATPDAEDLITHEAADALLDRFAEIEDKQARKKVKDMFVESFGMPRGLRSERVAEASSWLEEQIAAHAEAPAAETGEEQAPEEGTEPVPEAAEQTSLPAETGEEQAPEEGTEPTAEPAPDAAPLPPAFDESAAAKIMDGVAAMKITEVATALSERSLDTSGLAKDLRRRLAEALLKEAGV